ncbi:ArsR/SmtB family transcription factor [Allosalinactinospora lopnorensis]|uniref:ArsR/SmtB family transcription factor n=1 Tax=Allosalinactinospora lopnorensis TaxID=1352348 RepID=UPI000623F7DF|nr:metalloregulator ArsR/SmtB family transcription factor [Allosalinactinospora lopnorensis]
MLMSSEDSVEGAAVKLLGDPLRARIVRLLAREQMCTCHLIDETGARQPTISHHLKILREAGFVAAEPYGRFTYYRLRPERLRELAEAITGLAGQADQAQQTRRPCD